MSIVYTALLFFALLGSAAVGWAARGRLHERHVSHEAVDSIRLLMGMLLTFAALVLGLLTSNAKQRFDGFNNDLSAYSVVLVELDHRLRTYGPDADDIRALLRSYTASAIAETWPDETPPAGKYPRLAQAAGPAGVEGVELGDMLSDVDMRIERLVLPDEFHRQIATSLRELLARAIEQRWRLIFAAGSTISWPFMLVLTSWLTIIFAIFGLTSPRSRLVYAVVGLSALSIASPVYLIISYTETRTGLIQLSSSPMRAALSHMDRAS